MEDYVVFAYAARMGRVVESGYVPHIDEDHARARVCARFASFWGTVPHQVILHLVKDPDHRIVCLDPRELRTAR